MAAERTPAEEDARTRLKTQIAVSCVVGIVALWVILSKNYDDTYTKWATGLVGLVLGYWLE